MKDKLASAASGKRRAVTAHSSTREIVRELRTVNEDRHNQDLMPLSYGKFVAELEKRGL